MKCAQSNDNEEIIAEMITSGDIVGLDDGDSSDDGQTVRVRATNKNRLFQQSDAQFDRLYFDGICVYSEIDFGRLFKMPISIWSRFTRHIW